MCSAQSFTLPCPLSAAAAALGFCKGWSQSLEMRRRDSAAAKNALIAQCETLLKTHGSPSAYLESVLADVVGGRQFLDFLLGNFRVRC